MSNNKNVRADKCGHYYEHDIFDGCPICAMKEGLEIRILELQNQSRKNLNKQELKNKIIDECSIVTTRLLAEKYEIISCLKSDLCEIGKSLSCNEADEFGLEDILSAISEKDIEIVSCHKEIERLKKINSEFHKKSGK